MGISTAIGTNISKAWEALQKGRSGIQMLSLDGIQIPAGFISDQTSQDKRAEMLALHASGESLKDSGLEIKNVPSERIGTCVSSSKGDFENVLNPTHGFFLEKINSRLVQHYQTLGPSLNLVGACSTGLQSVSWGARWIQENKCDMVFAGASDSVLHPFLIHAYEQAGILAKKNSESPHKRIKPFDRNRTGTILGEGSGVVVLESLESAQKRGANIYGEILSSYYGIDPFHPIRMNPDGSSVAQILQHLFQKSQYSIDNIDLIHLHGTGTVWNDVVETRGIKSFFKEQVRKISFCATKPFTGHLIGASGVVELIFSLLAMKHGFVPPTLNLEETDPECDLDYTPGYGKEKAIRSLIGLAYGFGGHISGILVRKI